MGTRFFGSVLTLVLTVSLSGSVHAAAKAAAGTAAKSAGKSYQGTIVKLNTDLLEVDYGDSKPIRVAGFFTDKTVVTVDGKPGTTKDLARGQYVTITLSGRNAATIDVKTK